MTTLTPTPATLHNDDLDPHELPAEAALAPGACLTGCGRPRRRGRITCPPCWTVLPPAIRAHVTETARLHGAAILGAGGGEVADGVEAAREAGQ